MKPKAPANSASLVLILCLGVAAVFVTVLSFSQQEGVEQNASSSPQALALQIRDLAFDDNADGGITVVDAKVNAVIAVLEPGSNGFIRGVMRRLAQARKRQGIGAKLPFRLTRWDNGSITLEDYATGEKIDLRAFGPTNVEAFARFLPQKGA
jgi:putative photosynthetic complex assembly protein